ncbi:MAG: hypothetical protein IPQ02_08350 [Saprospiraceae bacterium]|nr:hypothetical protein [Candidatus Defluviibacterium haderslevense]
MNIWEIIKIKSQEIFADLDYRSKKKRVKLWKEDPTRHTQFPEDWLLKYKYFEIIINQPNDISIYGSIAKKESEIAKAFYDLKIKPFISSFNPQHFANNKFEGEEYYNYFETIIKAIIFSYTSIEAFSNILLEEGYEYHDEDKDIKYGKRYIESNFKLRDKLKLCLTDILKSTNPTNESWWQDFILLEQIRNEVIHSKPSLSEARYSVLLDDKIFRYIDTYKMVLNFYGQFIVKNKPDFLDDFPLGFGYDEFSEKYTTGKEIRQLLEFLNKPRQ